MTLRILKLSSFLYWHDTNSSSPSRLGCKICQLDIQPGVEVDSDLSESKLISGQRWMSSMYGLITDKVVRCCPQNWYSRKRPLTILSRKLLPAHWLEDWGPRWLDVLVSFWSILKSSFSEGIKLFFFIQSGLIGGGGGKPFCSDEKTFSLMSFSTFKFSSSDLGRKSRPPFLYVANKQYTCL